MRILFLLLYLLAPGHLLANDNVQVVTSIRPIQLITNEIMHGAGQSELLIQSDQSPHHFQLKPSQLKIASKTDLLIWVSDDFETGLNRLKNALPSRGITLELIKSFPANHLIGDNHDIDGHIWLSPENITLIAQLITQKLLQIDPSNQQLYLDNSLQLIKKVTDWKQKSQKTLRAIQPKYILEHQFLAYLEKSFGIKNIGSFRNNHDQGSSIRQLSALHETLQKTPAKCLLIVREPMDKQAKQLSSQYDLKVERVRLLGEDSSIKSIIDLLDEIVKQLSSC